ncbi:MAG: hypothetical protein QGH45_06390, partial [Myxococcota bacterium]|nr:hypothetical protein [Myxococcota bacterium]
MTDVPLPDTMPCSIPARLTAGDVVCRVTVTRLGGAWARISLATPLDPGLPAILEIDRPTDGERAWIRTRVERVHSEGTARGWKRSVDLALLEFVDRAALASVGAPDLHDGPDTFDHESVSIEVFSYSMEDSADKISPEDGTPDQPPRLPYGARARHRPRRVRPDAHRWRTGTEAQPVAAGRIPAHAGAPRGGGHPVGGGANPPADVREARD